MGDGDGGGGTEGPTRVMEVVRIIFLLAFLGFLTSSSSS